MDTRIEEGDAILINEVLEEAGCNITINNGDDPLCNDFDPAQMAAIETAEYATLCTPDGVAIPTDSYYELDEEGNVVFYEMTINGVKYDSFNPFPPSIPVYDTNLIKQQAQVQGVDVVDALNDARTKPLGISYRYDASGRIIVQMDTEFYTARENWAAPETLSGTGITVTYDNSDDDLIYTQEWEGAHCSSCYQICVPGDGDNNGYHTEDGTAGEIGERVIFRESYLLSTDADSVDINAILLGDGIGSHFYNTTTEDNPGQIYGVDSHTVAQRFFQESPVASYDYYRIIRENAFNELRDKIKTYRKEMVSEYTDRFINRCGGLMDGLKITYDGATLTYKMDCLDGSEKIHMKDHVDESMMSLLYYNDEAGGHYVIGEDGELYYQDAEGNIIKLETVEGGNEYIGPSGELLTVTSDSIIKKQVEDYTKAEDVFFERAKDDPKKFKGFNLQCYINQNIDGGVLGYLAGETTKIIELGNGKYKLTTNNYEIEISEEELLDYEHSDKVKAIIEAAKIELGYQLVSYEGKDIERGQEISVIPNFDGFGHVTSYTYYVNGEHYTVSTLEEVKSGIDSAIAEKPGYTTYNRNLSRRQNKAISDIEEEQYSELMDRANAISNEIADSCINEVDKFTTNLDIYSDNVKKIREKFKTNLNDCSNNLQLLSRLIDSIVNTYIQCDYDMRRVLDGILTGDLSDVGEYAHSSSSFIDKIFSLRHDSSGKLVDVSNLIVPEEFKKTFVSKYNDYVKEARSIIDDVYKSATKGVFVGRDAETIEFFKNNELTVSSEGYIKAEDFFKKFGSRIKPVFNGSIKRGDFPELDKYILPSVEPYMRNVSLLSDFSSELESVKYLENLGDNQIIDHIFDEEYRRILEEVRLNHTTEYSYETESYHGKNITTVKGTYMTPAEIAMGKYLGVSGNYIVTQEKLNEREGRYIAAEKAYNWTVNPDEFSAGLDGLLDGATSFFRDIAHIVSAPNDVTDWKKYYLGKYITECATASERDIKQMYLNGEITYQEYQARLAVKRDLDKADANGTASVFERTKEWYNVGETVGKTGWEIVQNIALTYMTGGYGAALKPLIEGTIKGARTAGTTNNSMYNSLAISDEAYIDDEYRATVALYGITTAIATAGSSIIKNYFKKGSDAFKIGKVDSTSVGDVAGGSYDIARESKFKIAFFKGVGETAKNTINPLGGTLSNPIGTIIGGEIKTVISKLPDLLYSTAKDWSYVKVDEKTGEYSVVGKDGRISRFDKLNSSTIDTFVKMVIPKYAIAAMNGDVYIKGFDENPFAATLNYVVETFGSKAVTLQKVDKEK